MKETKIDQQIEADAKSGRLDELHARLESANAGQPDQPLGEFLAKQVKTFVRISDVGTNCEAEVTDGKLTVTDSGGCHVERIIGPVDYSPERSVEVIAGDVLAAWQRGYDGNPHESQLTVEVTRGEESCEVEA